MKYFKTSLKTYDLFVSKNNTDKLSKNLKLHTTITPRFLNLNELFDKKLNLIENKDFFIEKYKHTLYDNEYNYVYTFKIKNVNYRLDFVVLKEPNIKNEELKNKNFISVSFSLKNVKDVDYDTPTKLDNQYDVLNYVIWIVNYFKNKNKNYIFMFGDPKDDRKFNIYEYIILKCFENYKIVKDYTSNFNNTNVGFYLIQNKT